ncbi:MAG TPA: VOC family protein [Solirubrobacteraceae bacterium]
MIQHVAIEIRSADADACARFWALLGFERVAPPPALAQRAAWVQRAGTQVHLLFVDEPVIAPQGHVAVVVDDYDGTLGALREAGLDPQPRTEHWNSPRCFVRCPVGHRIELMAFAPVGTPGRHGPRPATDR